MHNHPYRKYDDIPDVSDSKRDMFSVVARRNFHNQSYVMGTEKSTWMNPLVTDDPRPDPMDEWTAAQILGECRAALEAHAMSEDAGFRDSWSLSWVTGETLQSSGVAAFAIPSQCAAYIGTYLYEMCETRREVIDCYTGAALHEMSHLIHNKFPISYKYAVPARYEQLKGTVSNFIDDERVEEEVRQASQGFTGYIELMKRVLFDNTMKEADSFADQQDVAKMLMIFSTMVRHPHNVTDEMRTWKSVAGVCVFDALRAAMHKAPRSLTDVGKLTDSVMRVLVEQAEEYYEPQPHNCDKDEVKQEQNAPTIPEQAKGSPGNSQGGQFQFDIDMMGQMAGQGTMTACDEDIAAEAEKIYGDQTERVDWTTGNLDEMKSAMGCERGSGTPMPAKISRPVADGNARRAYEESLNNVRPYIGALKRALSLPMSYRRDEHRDRRSGHLDRRALWKSATSGRVFYRTEEHVAEGASVCLLLDGSYSMNAKDNGSRRIDQAREIGIGMAHALKGNQLIELEVYSFDSGGHDGYSNLFVHYGKQNPNIESMGRYQPANGNFDYVAIDLAAEIFLKSTENPNKVMFVISDGRPCTHPAGGGNPDMLTKKAVEKWRRHMKVVGIGVSTDSGEMIYGDQHMHFNTMSELSNELSRYVRRLANGSRV